MKKHVLAIIVAGTAAVLTGCAKDPLAEIAAEQLESPAAPGSALPHLAATPEGSVVMSWVEPLGDSEHALKFAVLEQTGWSAPREVARGGNWFVNWADFPSVVPIDENHWAAHWLVKREGGTYSYDVAIAVSEDAGESWSEPVTPHLDDTRTEHGFVSLFPDGEGFAALWLDGREMSEDPAGGGHASDGEGGMTLRAARIGFDATLGEQYLIDDLVCECCQTDAALTRNGIVAVYRDLTTEELRDVSVARFSDGQWTPEDSPGAEGWEMSACPVNGPAVDASDDRVAAAWFTGADGDRRVRVSLSEDAGASFSDPVDIDHDAIGRVDVVTLDDGGAVVSWLANTDDGAQIRLRKVNADATLGAEYVVTETTSARSSGFPQMLRNGDDLVIAWTDTGDPSRVRTAAITGAAGLTPSN